MEAIITVIKLGSKYPLDPSRIKRRLTASTGGLDSTYVDVEGVVDTVVRGLFDGVSTTSIEILIEETCAALCSVHPHYAILAGRIAVTSLHKQTKSFFSNVMSDLYHCQDQINGTTQHLIAESTFKIAMKYKDVLNAAVRHERDMDFTYFGIKTLQRSYLMKLNGRIAERPQHMFMRVSLAIHGEDIPRVLETYGLMSQRFFIHATPCLFNAGTPNSQLASCFLLPVKEDSIDGIYSTIGQCATISKHSGGIGLSVSNVRASGSSINGTNGTSNGLVPMLRVLNATVRHVDQGGRRPGALAVFVEPWHVDIFAILSLRDNHGPEEARARDLFYALWVPHLFMRRVSCKGNWTLFSPDEAPGLDEAYGEAFDTLYERYEHEHRGRDTIKAMVLWDAIIKAQTETGNPFMLYKDSANVKSNQQHQGTIKSSNLCTEIVQFTSPSEVAVCTLASIALPMMIRNGKFDFRLLHDISKIVTRNLNRVIDVNVYPLPEAKLSSMTHRPIGVGVQGLADAFMILELPFESAAARLLNAQIFETIYHGCLEMSVELAIREGPYASYKGSPMHRGQLQFDLWRVTPTTLWDWDDTRRRIAMFGIRNSLLVALMPTATTSQILGFTESFEPITSNLYIRRSLAGEFQVFNPWLCYKLVSLGMWNNDTRNAILASGGSVQGINGLTDTVKAVFKTVWEISQLSVIVLAAERGPFICQSQSLTIHMRSPTYRQLTSMHFQGWARGLKTGMYYLRTAPAILPTKLMVDDESTLTPRSSPDRFSSIDSTDETEIEERADPVFDPTNMMVDNQVATVFDSSLNDNTEDTRKEYEDASAKGNTHLDEQSISPTTNDRPFAIGDLNNIMDEGCVMCTS